MISSSRVPAFTVSLLCLDCDRQNWQERLNWKEISFVSTAWPWQSIHRICARCAKESHLIAVQSKILFCLVLSSCDGEPFPCSQCLNQKGELLGNSPTRKRRRSQQRDREIHQGWQWELKTGRCRLPWKVKLSWGKNLLDKGKVLLLITFVGKAGKLEITRASILNGQY